jgi:hypothetical protein
MTTLTHTICPNDCECGGPEYRILGRGEEILVGDQAYTWANPDCTHIDWVRFTPEWLQLMGAKRHIDEGHVPVRRLRAVRP